MIDRSAIAGMLIRLFEHWELTTDQQLDALGFSRTNRSILSRYRRGQPIANSRDTLERASYLLGMHANLRRLFPQNPDLACAWIKRRNQAFENQAPIEVIQQYGFAGLLMVRTYLNQACSQ